MNETVSVPFEPHSYQMRAIKLMMSQASLGLFLDPGLGKTATWLAAFTTLQKLGYVDKMLVIVPINAMYGTWPTEIDKYNEFKHLTWCFLHGPDKEWHLRNTDADIYLINPEGIQWLADKCDPSKLADVLCVDESTKFKNTGSKRFKAFRRIFPRFQRRWIGTGTPSPNGLEDLFGQIFILDGGAALGKYITHFRKRWFYQEGWNEYEWIPHDHAFEEITKEISPLVVVMEAKDYLDMPDLQVVDRLVSLPSKAERMYKDIEAEFLHTIEETGDVLIAQSNAAAGVKCRQIANGAVYLSTEPESKPWKTPKDRYEEVHDQKLRELDDLSEEIGEHPAIVVYEFQHDRQRITQKYPDWPCLTGVKGESLQTLIRMFNEGKIKRLLVQSGAGHGMNIQSSCHHMIWFGLTWNWEHYKQMVDRLYRQGQSSSMVLVYRILARGTLDTQVAQRLEEKRLEESSVKRSATHHRQQIMQD